MALVSEWWEERPVPGGPPELVLCGYRVMDPAMEEVRFAPRARPLEGGVWTMGSLGDCLVEAAALANALDANGPRRERALRQRKGGRRR